MAAKDCKRNGIAARELAPGQTEVIVDRTALCDTVYVLAQTLGRLEKRCGLYPGLVDAQVIQNAKIALVNARALLRLSAGVAP